MQLEEVGHQGQLIGGHFVPGKSLSLLCGCGEPRSFVCRPSHMKLCLTMGPKTSDYGLNPLKTRDKGHLPFCGSARCSLVVTQKLSTVSYFPPLRATLYIICHVQGFIPLSGTRKGSCTTFQKQQLHISLSQNFVFSFWSQHNVMFNKNI